MTDSEKVQWREQWAGRTATLPGGGTARLRVTDDRVTATAEWPGGRGGLRGDCGAPGKAAESHWFAFVKFAARHANDRTRSLGKGRSSPAPRGPIRYRQGGTPTPGMPGIDPRA